MLQGEATQAATNATHTQGVNQASHPAQPKYPSEAFETFETTGTDPGTEADNTIRADSSPIFGSLPYNARLGIFGAGYFISFIFALISASKIQSWKAGETNGVEYEAKAANRIAFLFLYVFSFVLAVGSSVAVVDIFHQKDAAMDPQRRFLLLGLFVGVVGSLVCGLLFGAFILTLLFVALQWIAHGAFVVSLTQFASLFPCLRTDNGEFSGSGGPTGVPV